jgi:hypothetical protein
MSICYAFMLVLRGIQLISKAVKGINYRTTLIEIGVLFTTLVVFFVFWLLTKKVPKAIRWLCLTVNLLEGATLVIYR